MSPDIALSCSIIPGQLLSLTYSLGCPGFNHLSPADQPTIELILVLRGETTGNNQQSLNLGKKRSMPCAFPRLREYFLSVPLFQCSCTPRLRHRMPSRSGS